MKVVDYKAGETIVRQGESGTLMYLVKSGEVEVLQEIGGTETSIATLGRGDFFGEMSLLEGEPRTHSVRTLNGVKVVHIDRRALLHLLQRNPDIAVRIVTKLGKRLESTEDMVIRAYDSLLEAKKGTTERIVEGRARLVAINAELIVELPQKSEVLVGRLDPVSEIHPDVDLTSIDPQTSTSRRHARVFRRGETFFIQEESSTNGTRVNDQRISAERPIEIRHGDTISFGAVRMRFEVVA